jgi:hypothetical protein
MQTRILYNIIQLLYLVSNLKTYISKKVNQRVLIKKVLEMVMKLLKL